MHVCIYIHKHACYVIYTYSKTVLSYLGRILIFSNAGSYSELHLTVKIPICIFHDSSAEVRKYKYHVESSATENTLKSLEFISCPEAGGELIDRSLKLYFDNRSIQSGGE